MSEPVVLFVCVRNAGRSQIAEALFNRRAAGRARARSAGSEPADAVQPEVVASLAAAGLDISTARPKAITPSVTDGVDVVVGMGCGDACPVIPGARTLEWNTPDPHGRGADEVDRIRDDIAASIERLLAELGLS
ncbi:MAG: low molecular weight phosphatase family protein [Actinomycetota bacterium]